MMRRRREKMVTKSAGRRAAIVLGCAVLATGCASAVALNVPRFASDTAPCITQAPERDLIVGVALSGGGSRAALFGAAGLEALGGVRAPDGRSVLEQVAYISSVSGGSLAAAYYGMHKPPRETPVLGADGAMTEPYQTFFAGFREKLNQDFESALIWRQIGSFRWILNSALAARSLSEILDERLLGPGTIGDLAARESRGDSPHVIINTTLYNHGRRLTLTALPPDAGHYDFFQDLGASAARLGRTAEYPPILRRRWESLMAVTPLEIHINPCPIKLAGAVAGSASFPPLVGPVTFHVGDEEVYWHAGDGGLYENSGVESLAFVLLKQMQDRKVRRALILSFDSSFPFSVGARLLSRRARPWSLLDYDFSRIPGIMEERASAYAALFFRSLQIQGVFPDSQTLHIVLLRHTDVHWKDDLSDLPEACRDEDPPLTSPQAVVERIAEIPTRFAIASECDRQLLIVAAAKVVGQTREEIEDFLAGRPTPERTAK